MTSAFSTTEFYSIPEIAHLLEIRQRDVRTLLNERELIAVRRGDNNALSVLGGQLVERDGRIDVLKSLKGTITQLGDLGLNDEEILEWLTEEAGELGTTPLEALRSGNIHRVRRAALTAIA